METDPILRQLKGAVEIASDMLDCQDREIVRLQKEQAELLEDLKWIYRAFGLSTREVSMVPGIRDRLVGIKRRWGL